MLVSSELSSQHILLNLYLYLQKSTFRSLLDRRWPSVISSNAVFSCRNRSFSRLPYAAFARWGGALALRLMIFMALAHIMPKNIQSTSVFSLRALIFRRP